MSFWELIIVYANGGQWAPSAKFATPPWLKHLVTPLPTPTLNGCDQCCHSAVTEKY